jgi:hypothetical protein
VPDGIAPFELIANDGQTEKFELDTDAAKRIFEESVSLAKEKGLPWRDEIVTLKPEQRLVNLVRKSRMAKSIIEE